MTIFITLSNCHDGVNNRCCGADWPAPRAVELAQNWLRLVVPIVVGKAVS